MYIITLWQRNAHRIADPLYGHSTDRVFGGCGSSEQDVEQRSLAACYLRRYVIEYQCVVEDRTKQIWSDADLNWMIWTDD